MGVRPVLMFVLLLAVGAAPAAAQTKPAAGPSPAEAPANPAAETPPLYVVSYVEVAPASAAKTAGILRRYAAASRTEAGNTGFVALREHQRPGRFAIVESWHDKAAYDAQAPMVKAVDDKLQPLLIAPIDRRTCLGLDIEPEATPATAKGVVYVLTHIDVIPLHKDTTVALIKALAAASRKEEGNLRFDALVQDNRSNHMFLVDAWRDRAARNAHITADATKEFRDKEAPFAGALYDERLYEIVR